MLALALLVVATSHVAFMFATLRRCESLQDRVAELDGFVPLGRQLFRELLFHLKTAVIRSDTYSHLLTLSPGAMPGDLTLGRGFDVIRGTSELLQQLFERR